MAAEDDDNNFTQLIEGYDPTAPKATFHDLDAIFGSLDEPLTEEETEEEGREQKLDITFGSLEEPLTEWETEDEGRERDAMKKKKRRGR